MSLESMKQRIQYYGGAAQQDRMIKDKARSMFSATKYSYQSARFSKYPKHCDETIGLFNPVTQNENFDTKMVSVPWEACYHVGEVFKWHNTDTYWICFLQDKTELAYFRGQCRRCDYKISWVSQEKEVINTLASVIGPTVPSLRTSSSMQAKVAQDFPNANLQILVPENEENKKFFGRYQKFFIKGITYIVEEVDNISMPGVIQLNATEHYTNDIEDDTEENLRNAWNVQPIMESSPTDYAIQGPSVVKPGFETEYTSIYDGGRWLIVENEGVSDFKMLPAKFVENDHTLKTVHVYWDSAKSGQYTLGYELPNGKLYQRHILVESLL